MLRVPNLIGEEKAEKIVTEFVNYRLLEIMEDIILDEVVWGMAMRGELDESASTKSFDELVDLKELMLDDQFAAAVSMMYLPENYPLNKANKKFFGLYKLLKAKKEYVPDLAMEYILYSILESEVGEVDMINQDMEDGLFDDLEDGMFDGFDEDFDEDFEDDEDDFFGDDFDDEEELSTVERIPESDRTVVKKAVLEAYKGEFEGKELEETAEYLVNCYEDLREYLDICFWDTDFLFLDDYTEEQLKQLEANEQLGIVAEKEKKIIEFPFQNREGKKTRIKAELDIDPWDLEDE